MLNTRLFQLSGSGKGIHRDVGFEVLVAIASSCLWGEFSTLVELLCGVFYVGECIVAITKALLGGRILDFTSCPT